MNHELTQKLLYSYQGQNDKILLPNPLKDSLKIITDFFSGSSNNKLCLVFPSKECAAQWITIPIVLDNILADFQKFKNEIAENYKHYKIGQKLILNGEAIVEWVGINENGVAFRTKGGKESSGAEFTIGFTQSTKLQKTQQTRKLSSIAKVNKALPGRIKTPIDGLLEIRTYGNKEFIKNNVCLVTKYKSFNDSMADITINNFFLHEYIQVGKIDENGNTDFNSPLLLSNNLCNLGLYLTMEINVSYIIIDGFSIINERGISDFNDIEALKLNIPTILITDLSEIESFENIGNYGFEFFNFTKEYLDLDFQTDNSPFHVFNNKLEKYKQFNLVKEICQNNDLETISMKIHSIEKDDSNNDLNILKIYLIQLTNAISRICHVPMQDEINLLIQKLSTIENLFQRTRLWLGDSNKIIEDSISLLKTIIENFTSHPSEKCERLKSLLKHKKYDYIICPTGDEAQALSSSLPAFVKTRVITIADVNDNLLTDKPARAIITGWPKSNNLNRILSSFIFSELIFLFYQFENKYYNSLQRRNRKNYQNIKSTISRNDKSIGLDDLYAVEEAIDTNSEKDFDIFEFEIKLDNTQYSKYSAKGSFIESIKAKRIEFEYELFVYSSESHRFLVINELIEKQSEKATIYRKKLDALKSGDVIALINTDRDILAELVEKNTNKKDLAAVKKWTELWKNLLKEHFVSHGNDFKKLVEDLRKNECKKHEATIRTWLQDANRIGPNDDSDLISIALMTNSDELLDNISKVREAISKMVGWRMQAADYISNQIRAKIHEIIDDSFINTKVDVEGLGRVTIIKVNNISNVWENIDVRYVNRLLQKEIM